MPDLPPWQPAANVRRLRDADGGHRGAVVSFPKGWTASELLAAVFPDPKYVIPGIVPEGLSIVAGPPKVGKSWLAMNAAVAVGSGGKAFGRLPVEQGHVLYLALEDPGRRLQKRLRQVMAEGPTPSHLTFVLYF